MWKAIPGFPDYYVSDLGQVRGPRRVLKPQRHKQGYQVVNLKLDGKRYSKLVHSLVLLAFVGPRPEGLCIRHLNNDPTDNSLSNLAYGTLSENQLDRLDAGTYFCKLNPRQVRVIRGLYKCGFTQKRLAEMFSVNPITISRLIRKHTWANVD